MVNCPVPASVTTICPSFIRTPMTDINPYRMPFLLEVDEPCIVARDRTGKRFAIVPWQMAVIGACCGWCQELATRGFRRKPRI